MKKLLLLCCTLTTTFQIAFTQAWSLQLDFNEAGMPGFPNATTTLVDASTATFTATYDIFNRGTEICTGVTGVYTYGEGGGDGIDDLRVTITRVTSATNAWTQVEGDYATTSSGSFRSDYSISDRQSQPNDWAYIKIEFELLGDLSASICPSLFETRHTSTNGSSEAYEWTLVAINNELTATEEMNIANYTNLIYNDLSGSSYFDVAGNVVNPAAATNMPLPNGQTISEFITGTMDIDGSPGGLVRNGLWAIDDFNTTILDGPEAAATNPDAGNGSINDDQTLSATDDFGLTVGDQIQTITYYFGLSDVAFDTDGDGNTRTNTLPSAGVTFFNLGFPTPPTIASTDGNCGDNSGTATINLADGTPDFILSGDLSGSGFSDNELTITGLDEGMYNFTVTDAKGCQTSSAVVVDIDCALPVELTFFKANEVENGVLLEWQTASEIDNAHFEVERSKNGKEFISLGKVEGYGTTVERQSYHFLDQKVSSNLHYYRLKQVDFDGTFEYSAIVAVRIKKERQKTLHIYPSPVLDWLTLESKSEVKQVEIWAMSGQLIRVYSIPDTQQTSIDVSDLASGQYLLKMKTIKGWNKSRFVKK